jgi:uncharacterized lipoprotein YajG
MSTSGDKKNHMERKKENFTYVKDADKTILRYNIARKIKLAETAAKSRGYTMKSDNWLR